MFGWVGEENKATFNLLDNRDQTFLKGSFLYNDIVLLGPCCSLCCAGYFLPPYLILIAQYIFYIYNYLDVQPNEILDIPELDTF